MGISSKVQTQDIEIVQKYIYGFCDDSELISR